MRVECHGLLGILGNSRDFQRTLEKVVMRPVCIVKPYLPRLLYSASLPELRSKDVAHCTLTTSLL